MSEEQKLFSSHKGAIHQNSQHIKLEIGKVSRNDRESIGTEELSAICLR